MDWAASTINIYFSLFSGWECKVKACSYAEDPLPVCLIDTHLLAESSHRARGKCITLRLLGKTLILFTRAPLA